MFNTFNDGRIFEKTLHAKYKLLPIKKEGILHPLQKKYNKKNKQNKNKIIKIIKMNNKLSNGINFIQRYFNRKFRRIRRQGRRYKNFQAIYDTNFWKSIGTWRPFTVYNERRKYLRRYTRKRTSQIKRIKRRNWKDKLKFYDKFYNIRNLIVKNCRKGMTYRKRKNSRRSVKRQTRHTVRSRTFTKGTYKRRSVRNYTKRPFTLKPLIIYSIQFKKRKFTKGFKYTVASFRRKLHTNRMHTRIPQWLRNYTRKSYTKSYYTRKLISKKHTNRKTFRYFSRRKFTMRSSLRKFTRRFWKKPTIKL